MRYFFKFYKLKNIIIFLIIAFITVSFFIDTKFCVQSILNGLSLWFFNVLPVLFPFFVCTKLLTDLNLIQPISKIFNKPMKFLFNLPGAASYIFIISMISGYPTGAKLIQEYYKAGKLNYQQCVTCAALCSSSSPLFVFGTVALLIKNFKGAVIIYSAHLLSCIINGIIFRCKKYNDILYDTTIQKDFNLSDSIYTSTISILNIGGLICIFGLLCDLMLKFEIIKVINYIFIPLNKLFNYDIGTPFIIGFFEITKGIASINLPFDYTVILCAALLSFSGLCIIFQQHTYLKDCKISFKKLFLLKSVQCGITFFLAILGVLLFGSL